MEEREEAAANKTQNEVSGCLEQMKKKKKKNNSSCGSNDKRRFSDEQIKLLESIFETETRLEPKKKLQVARELGLQPRQVAIWFQNRRARWKSKRIEQEYRLLRDSYDNLLSRVELLKNEKQSLLLQVQKLSVLLGKPREGSTTRSDKLMEGSDKGKIALEEDTRNENRETGAQLEVDKKTAAMRSDDEKRSRDVGDSGDQGRQLINSKHGDDYHCGGGSVASFDQRWYGDLASSQAQLDDLPCSSSKWFDSWI